MGSGRIAHNAPAVGMDGWRRMLTRWATLQLTPEVSLACEVAASGAVEWVGLLSEGDERAAEAHQARRLRPWVEAVGIRWAFFVEQVRRAARCGTRAEALRLEGATC